MPIVDEPRPINSMKIGIVMRELLPLKTLRRAATAPSKAPDLITNTTDAYVMNTRNEMSAASTIPS